MQAWLIDNAGDGALTLARRPEPAMGPGDIRVRVHAVGVNRADLLQRRGLYPAPPGVTPDIPGLEYAGVVAEVGSAVQTQAPGDRVMGLVGGGAYAEEVVVSEHEAIPVPPVLTLPAAAAVPEAFLTAYRALFLEGGLQPGGWCLLRAARSSVGIAGIQLAHALGARVIASGRYQERLASLGRWDPAVIHGEDQGPLTDAVRTAAPAGVDVALDLVGGGHLRETMKCLRPGGTQVVVGLLGGTEDTLDMARLLFRGLTLRAMTMRSLALDERIRMARLCHQRLTPLFQAGRLEPVVDRVMGWHQAPEAHQVMEQGEHTGKIVLRVT